MVGGRIKKAQSRDAIHTFLLAWIAMLIIVVALLWFLYHVRHEADKTIVQADERQRVASALAEIGTEFHTISSDLRYLADQALLQDWLSQGQDSTRARLAGEYLAFARRKGLYDQVRLIDEHGREIVRVNWNNGQPSVVPERELQYKGDRYYVRDSFVLERDAIYVSPFDLNIEQGQIERPLKPMIRLATPVFDQAGQKRGLIVLNYLGQRLLDRLRANAAQTAGGLWLLNADGYWLLGPRPKDEWGFMFPEVNSRFSIQHTQAWAAIANGAQQGQFTMDDALFSYAKLTPVTLLDGPNAFRTGGERWIVMSHLPPGFLDSRNTWLDRSMLMTFFAMAVLTAAIAAAIAHLRLRRRRAEAAVQASEARFRALLESAPDGLVITGSDGRIQMVNNQTERLFGYARGEMLGQPVEILMPERYRGRHAGHRKDFVGEPHARPMGLELCGRRKDGSEFPASISLSPVQTDQGLLVVSDIRDATAQKQAEGEIRDLNRRLEQHIGELQATNQELESFSYSISHDLRAPLRAIDGFSRILLSSYSDRLDEAGREHLGRVRRAAQHMGALIDDILKLSRVTRAEIKPEPVELGAIAQELLAELQRQEPERRVRVEIAPEMNARGDARLLRVALENLLGNAWKFTARRSEALIEFGSEDREGRTVFFVRDNGAGFDMAYADKLFGAFQRLHDAREFPGTGIGLATVQRVIHKHGGQVWAEAAVDQGATFYFTLGQEE